MHVCEVKILGNLIRSSHSPYAFACINRLGIVFHNVKLRILYKVSSPHALALRSSLVRNKLVEATQNIPTCSRGEKRVNGASSRVLRSVQIAFLGSQVHGKRGCKTNGGCESGLPLRLGGVCATGRQAKSKSNELQVARSKPVLAHKADRDSASIIFSKGQQAEQFVEWRAGQAAVFG